MSRVSEKGKTNKKFTTNPEYRDAYDRIFAKSASSEQITPVEISEPPQQTQPSGQDEVR